MVPLYYKIGDDGIPHDWIAVMKEAIKSNAPLFSARENGQVIRKQILSARLEIGSKIGVKIGGLCNEKTRPSAYFLESKFLMNCSTWIPR